MGNPPLLIAGQHSGYTLDGYRFQDAPYRTKNKGLYIKLSKKYLPTATAGVTQSWDSVPGDVSQTMKWKMMSREFYAELKTRFDATKAAPATTFEMIFHDELPEQTWIIGIEDFVALDNKAGNFWQNAILKYRLVRQVS